MGLAVVHQVHSARIAPNAAVRIVQAARLQVVVKLAATGTQ